MTIYLIKATLINAVQIHRKRINPSQHLAKDFNQCRNSRHLKVYYPLLQWCEIFLKHKVLHLIKAILKPLPYSLI
ncbi:hypothetical protein LS72_004550 [Helicobacter apodemus]|uniref:Uncharacterized protein n=1 Tax=Helicobacter apodemus TaxID=135569 RepID=A0A4U8UEN7_9HELI|nr:hypothetical protein LS72_004550 [Helicobacter apodemus]